MHRKRFLLTSAMISLLCLPAQFACMKPQAEEAAKNPAHGDSPPGELPRELDGYDPSGLVRFKTPAEAEALRQDLIRFIWPSGFPAAALPAATTGIGPDVFSQDLAGLDATAAASVERLDAVVDPYDFHGLGYLLRPAVVNGNTKCLVVINSGHRKDGPFAYGVNDTVNRLLREGFTILVSDMPLVGFNTDSTVELASERVNLEQRGSAAHKEMFERLVPHGIPGGQIFRLFLEPMVQGVNHFLATTPDGVVAYVGLSGGGWTGHMLAALDTRIRLSIPVAGAMPLYARDFSPGSLGDTEQYHAPLYGETDANGDGITDTATGVASWLEIFVLGGYGEGRRQIQLLNFYDDCCFSGPVFKTYGEFVSNTVRRLGQGQWEVQSDATHKTHQISPHALNTIIVPALREMARAVTPLCVSHMSEPLAADGNLDEPCYAQHAPLKAFRVAGDAARTAPSTRAWLFWAEERLVCAFECTDSSPAWAAPEADERLVDGQDRVELFLWPKDASYFCIEAAPGGAVHDYEARFYRRFDDTWSPVGGWACKARQTQEGYAVEMIIPRQAIEAMGLKLEAGVALKLGLFRADFDKLNGEPTWITWVDHGREPDFHVSESFGTALFMPAGQR